MRGKEQGWFGSRGSPGPAIYPPLQSSFLDFSWNPGTGGLYAEASGGFLLQATHCKLWAGRQVSSRHPLPSEWESPRSDVTRTQRAASEGTQGLTMDVGPFEEA